MPRYAAPFTKTGSDSVLQIVELLSSATVQRIKVYHVVVKNTGTESADVVFSYVVHRHPPVPGKELPIVIALIDLDEGVRMVGEVFDVADDEIEIGMRLHVDFREIDDDLTLPIWRKA